MREFLERFGLTEFFAYLCPGVILGFSVVLWTQPDLDRLVGPELSNQQLVVAFLLLVVLYALGFIIAWWSSAGANLYAQIRYRQIVSSGASFGQKLTSRCLRCWLWFFHWFPLPPTNLVTVGARVRIADGLRRYSGVEGLSVSTGIWEMMSTFRTVISGRVSNAGRPILTEAEAVHTRSLFALGVSLAVLLWGIQSFIRLILVVFIQPTADWDQSNCWSYQLPAISPLILVTTGILEVAASFGLRWIAGRLWERELLLTHSLTQ